MSGMNTQPKSTHRAEVVPVVLMPHPNAESLSIVQVYGYTVCVRTDDWKDKDLGIYIVPDSVVPDTPQFAFLQGKRRIKVKKLRGIMSEGMLIPAPEGAEIGEDFAERLGITRYEPPLPPGVSTAGKRADPPAGFQPIYDVEAWQRYGQFFEAGEEVVVTEKIHGTSARYAFVDDRMYCGQRREWQQEDTDNLWWKILYQNPWLEAFCKAHPDITVYGEIYGQIQDLRYGTAPKEVRFAVFDLLRGREWLSWDDSQALAKSGGLHWAPVVYRGPYDREKIKALADGPSLIPGASHIREGVVVKPVIERRVPELGRLCLKLVSDQYLERA